MQERDRHGRSRAWLRDATTDAHARTDDAFSAFDLGCADGISAFFQAQHAGLAAAERELRLHGRREWATIVGCRRDAVAHDLADLSVTPGLRLTLRTPEPIGIAYVVAGSLHGTSVLRARYTALHGRDDVPRFFAATDWKPLWNDALATLERHGEDAAILMSACATFRCFEQAAKAATRLPAPQLESVA